MVQLENESQRQPLISNKRILQTRPAALSDNTGPTDINDLLHR